MSDATRPLPLSDADVDELATLAADAPTLFEAPTTTNHDRKEIIRTLVSQTSNRSPQRRFSSLGICVINSRRA